ncbi:hypothetical protein [Adonisia turfae]|nr:hypothetical protein [Adonisia turfae]
MLPQAPPKALRSIRMLSEMLKNRADELGMSKNDIVLGYCELLKARGEEAKPVNKRNMIYRIFEGKTVPRLDTFKDLIQVLGGEVKVTWKQETEVKL